MNFHSRCLDSRSAMPPWWCLGSQWSQWVEQDSYGVSRRQLYSKPAMLLAAIHTFHSGACIFATVGVRLRVNLRYSLQLRTSIHWPTHYASSYFARSFGCRFQVLWRRLPPFPSSNDLLSTGNYGNRAARWCRSRALNAAHYFHCA